ncbi:hypothetical protein BE04_19900 [Sorangium cellulosum]|uniref:Uncharacterized protein n=2 Tax=Sorangium cellulosum TaxID=56 RepID=A0A150P3K2_SORCE|nr:hypothetical protein [Sorangium cellulosum]AGP37688.1 hypothetical protein SCE1572_26355 [Sorangium cellulosum So0157-2]KYF50228.1 hypothetical protein BE04_19900 [Sorangium cellulosum]
MTVHDAPAAGYVVPTYEAAPGEVWYHFLHGNVPGHQIDFIYRPDVPQGPLTQQHFSHLTQLINYIEPRSRHEYAFAIGNLSRDDTQHEPGHGGVALLFGLRIQGAKDHAGRQDPPFCHAIAAIDRHLDAAGLLEVALSFHRKLLPGVDSEASGSGWYHTYVRYGQNADALLPILRGYIVDFADLPAPEPSLLGLRWTAAEADPPRRVVIVHGPDEPFDAIAACAARIAGVLVESDIRWTAISNGREADMLGGVSVRFVPEHEARAEAEGGRVLRLGDVPHEPKEVAEQLFGAQEVRGARQPVMAGWQPFDGQPGSERGAARAVEGAPARAGAARGDGGVAVGAGTGRTIERAKRPAVREAEIEGATAAIDRSRRQLGLLIGVGVALAIGGAAAAVALGMSGARVENQIGSPSALASSASYGGEEKAPRATSMEAPGSAPTAAIGALLSAPTASSAPTEGGAQRSPSADKVKRGGGTRKSSGMGGKSGRSVFKVP